MEALILIVVVSNFLIGMTLDILNQKNILKPWPEEVRGIFTQAQVKRVVAYSRENFQLTAIRKIISTALVVLMIAQGGFNVVNDWVISITPNERYQSLLFLGVLSFRPILPCLLAYRANNLLICKFATKTIYFY